MKKSELIESISQAADLPKSSATSVLNALINTVMDSLKEGEAVVLPGFGTFSVKDRAARTGRNPQTGETIAIPAARIPGFKAGKALKDAVQ